MAGSMPPAVPPPPESPVPVILRWWRQFWYDEDVFRTTCRMLGKQCAASFAALMTMGVIVFSEEGVILNTGKLRAWGIGLVLMAIILGIPTQPVTKKPS